MSVLVLPLLPLLAAALVWLTRRRPALAAPVAVGSLVASMLLGFWAAATGPVLDIAWSPAVQLSLRVDGFARVMVVLVPFIAAPIVAYAAVTEPVGRARLVALLLAFVAAMTLLVVAADFVTLLIGWELVGATSWALIGHGWRDRANVEAGTQAFLTTRLGDLGLYVAAGAVFAATGSFAFDGLADAASPWREIVAGGVLLAAAAKSAQVPFSPWLFAAMAGPTPVSALLHSATLVAAGAYLLIRLAPSLEGVVWFLPVVAIVGLTTALLGGLVALVQTHAKRALAASTSAQYGLMFIAIGAGSTAAAGAQLVTHAAFKSLLFLAAGVAIHATGSMLLGRLRLGRELPFVAVATGVGALALAGLPPLGGAWSKEAIVAAAVETSVALGIATFAAGFLSALYVGRFQLLAFGPDDGGSGNGSRQLRRPTATELAALAVLAATTIGLAILWLPGTSDIVVDLTGGELTTGSAWEFFVAVGLLLLAGFVVLLLDRRDRLLDLGVPPALQAAVGDWFSLPRATSALVVAPTLRLSAALGRADDRVVDAGVRAAARIAQLVSSLVARRVEFSIDGVVGATAAVTMRTAAASRRADDAGVDGAVEATGRGVGLAGRHSRRLQTGQSHHYFVIVAVGLVLIAVILFAAPLIP
ncbi:MAG: NADH-quinone oxidoreductase subunit 5 family protein [Candidatus Limnocylindrales bacterium]